MKPDPPIDEIREIRHQISAEHGHDPERLIRHYQKLEQERYRERLVPPPVAHQVPVIPRQ